MRRALSTLLPRAATLFGSDRLVVHQFLPTLSVRDAVGSHTLETQRALEMAEIAGKIWVEQAHPDLAHRSQSYDRFPIKGRSRRPRLLLYQASVGTHGLADFLLERREPKTLYYHNITPSHFFEPYDAGAAATLERGREDLKRMGAQMSIAMAASEFNAQELRGLGFENIRVIPPYLPAGLAAAPDAAELARLQETKKGCDLLFVGRVAPNKGHTHLLRTFAALRAAIDPNARLSIIGLPGPELYMRALFGLAEQLRLDGVTFTGPVPPSHLAAYYHTADAFVCLSEHEGFGLPLVEAMRSGLPVIAYGAAAVPETLAGTGVLVRTLDPMVVAEVIGRVVRDDGLRAEICRRQLQRALELASIPRDRLIVETLKRLAGGIQVA